MFPHPHPSPHTIIGSGWKHDRMQRNTLVPSSQCFGVASTKALFAATRRIASGMEPSWKVDMSDRSKNSIECWIKLGLKSNFFWTLNYVNKVYFFNLSRIVLNFLSFSKNVYPPNTLNSVTALELPWSSLLMAHLHIPPVNASETKAVSFTEKAFTLDKYWRDRRQCIE